MSDAVDTLKTKRTLEHDGVLYEYFSLHEAARHIGAVSHLPFSLKVVLENLLRVVPPGTGICHQVNLEHLAQQVVRPDGSMQIAGAISRIDTDNELAYFRNGGILNHVLRGMTA